MHGSDVDRAVIANFSTKIEGTPREILFFPEGTHTIEASIDGKPGVAEVTIDETIEEAFIDALNARLADEVLPNIDFNHEGGRSAGRAESFRYEPGKGLMLALHWSKSGKEAVDGLDYSYFSPSFSLSDDGRPVGLPATGPIGGLVNDPAFRSIQKIAASRASKPTSKNMSTELIEAANTRAVNAENAAKEVQAKLEKAEAKVTEIQAKFDEAQKQIEDQAKAAAAEKVKTHGVMAGRLAANDADSIAYWEAALLNDKADIALAQLNKLPVHFDVTRPIVKAGAGDPGEPATENPMVKAAREAEEKGENVTKAVQAALKAEKAKGNTAALEEYRSTLKKINVE